MDSKMYGETESPDCPDVNDKNFCKKIRKSGILAGVHSIGMTLDMHPTMPVLLPNWGGHEITQGPWGGQAEFRNIEFHNFKAKSL